MKSTMIHFDFDRSLLEQGIKIWSRKNPEMYFRCLKNGILDALSVTSGRDHARFVTLQKTLPQTYYPSCPSLEEFYPLTDCFTQKYSMWAARCYKIEKSKTVPFKGGIIKADYDDGLFSFSYNGIPCDFSQYRAIFQYPLADILARKKMFVPNCVSFQLFAFPEICFCSALRQNKFHRMFYTLDGTLWMEAEIVFSNLPDRMDCEFREAHTASGEVFNTEDGLTWKSSSI